MVFISIHFAIRANFQMTVESNHVIALVLVLVGSPAGSKESMLSDIYSTNKKQARYWC